MPDWLIAVLKWGGYALAVVVAVAVIFTEIIAPAPACGETSAPVALYWVLVVVGGVAANAGCVSGRRKGCSNS